MHLISLGSAIEKKAQIRELLLQYYLPDIDFWESWLNDTIICKQYNVNIIIFYSIIQHFYYK